MSARTTAEALLPKILVDPKKQRKPVSTYFLAVSIEATYRICLLPEGIETIRL